MINSTSLQQNGRVSTSPDPCPGLREDANTSLSSKNESKNNIISTKELVSFCIVYLMPFTYTATARLPAIFFLIELVDTYHTDLRFAGLFQALTYLLRLTTLSVSLVSTRKSAIAATLAALSGFLIIGFSKNKFAFIIGNILTGFGEITGVLKLLVKVHLVNEGLESVGSNMKVQISVKKFSTIVSFLLGGLLYDHYGVLTLSLFGSCLLIVQLCALLFSFKYMQEKNPLVSVCVSNDDPESTGTNLDCPVGNNDITPFSDKGSQNPEAALSEIINENDQGSTSDESQSASSEIYSGRPSLQRKPSEIIDAFALDEHIEIRWIDYFIAFSNMFQSLMNGFLYGTAPLLMFEVYAVSKTMVGFYLAVAALAAMVAAMISFNDYAIKGMNQWLPSPFNYYCFLLGSTCMMALTAIPSLVTYIVGMILTDVFVTLFVSFLESMQSKTATLKNYKKLASYGQMFRRAFGLITMFLSPLFYQIMPTLPNIVGSVACLCFTLMLVVAFEFSKKSNLEDLRLRYGSDNIKIDGPCVHLDLEPERRLTFADQIVLARLSKSMQQNPSQPVTGE